MTDEEQVKQMQAIWAEKDSSADADGWAALFAPTGKYVSGRGEFVGRDAIRQSIVDRTARNPANRRTMHIFGLPIIRVNGNEATNVLAYAAYGRVGDGPWEIMTIGRFHNKLIRENGQWYFTEMHNRSIGPSSGPATTAAPKG